MKQEEQEGIGMCEICGDITVLKSGVCEDCEHKYPLM